MAWLLRSAALNADGATPDATESGSKRRGRPPIEVSLGIDHVMPAQWFPPAGSQTSLQPEKRLMLAVLSDAVDIIVRRHGAADARSRALVEEAESWIDSDERGWPFSFLELCDALGLEPDCVRRGLARFRQRGDYRRPTPGSLRARSRSTPGASDDTEFTEMRDESSEPDTVKSIA